MNKDALFNVIKQVENVDGSVTLDIEVTDELVELYKKATGKKRATKKAMQEFLHNVIVDMIDSYGK